jgi:MATE family, multidrug efflux pump
VRAMSEVSPRDASNAAANRSGAVPLLEQTPIRAIVALAAPTTGVMLIATTSNILHTYFVSRLGADAIAAVSLVFPISLIMITLIGGGLGTGISSGIARALGGGRGAEARAVAEHALALISVLAVVLTIALELGAGSLFSAMGGKGEVLRQSILFARVLFAGLVLTFHASTLDSIMRGEGNVRIPAVCATLSLLLQIVLTPIYMFVLELGLAGAPLATLTGQLVGILPRVRYVLGGHGQVRPRLTHAHWAWQHLAVILRVGVPASLSATLSYVGLIVLTGTFAHIDDAHLAAYGLATRLDFLILAAGYGVAAATITLVAMASGAGRPDLIRQYTTRTIVLVIALIAVPAGLVILRPELWIGIFTTESAILDVGRLYFRIVGPSYFFSLTTMVLASPLPGFGRATTPLAVMVGRVAIVIAGAILLTRVLGYGARPVFFLIAASNVLACFTLGGLFRATMPKGGG